MQGQDFRLVYNYTYGPIRHNIYDVPQVLTKVPRTVDEVSKVVGSAHV
jgi:hypothetical protein